MNHPIRAPHTPTAVPRRHAALLAGAGLAVVAAVLVPAARLGGAPPTAGDGGFPRAAAQSGAVWRLQETPTRLTLRGADFVDPDHGWIVGGEGKDDEKCVILRTTNGGDTWRLVRCPVPLRLDSVSFVDRRSGWAIGVRGLVLRTDDGGESWARQDPGTTNQLKSVQSLDGNLGWIAVAQADFLLKTTDGGASWQKVMLTKREDISRVFFLDQTHGWALGGNGVLLATADGGATWRYVDFGSRSGLHGLHFVDTLHGWLTGWEVRATRDGGATWRQLPEPENTLVDVRFFDPLTGFGVGDEGLIQTTTDGGETWVRQAEELNDQPYTGLAAAGPQWLWAVGVNGIVMRGHDPQAVVRPSATPSPSATATAVPSPTATPSPTPSPTPAGPWLRLGDGAEPLLVAPGGSLRLDVSWGNMPAVVEIAARLEGPVTFQDGLQTHAATVSRSSGAGVYPLPLAAAADAVRGEPFTLSVTVAGQERQRAGAVAWQAWLARCARRAP